MAKDRGYPPLSRTVEVQIDVVDRANNPPVWDHVVYGPIYIKENMAVGAKVVSIKARSVTLSMLRAALCTNPPCTQSRGSIVLVHVNWYCVRIHITRILTQLIHTNIRRGGARHYSLARSLASIRRHTYVRIIGSWLVEDTIRDRGEYWRIFRGAGRGH